MKKILITGASGFVGSCMVETFLSKNPTYEIHAGIRSTSSRVYLTDARIRFFELDFTNTKKLTEQCRQHKFDYIIHCAGVTKADKKKDYFRGNSEYTQNFIQALIDAEAVPEKFVFLSSLAAYGPADKRPRGYVMEEDEPWPITAYGESKLDAERYIEQLENFPFLIFRPTAVFGPREKDIFTFFTLLNKHFEPYIGFKKQELTFIYVKDLAELIVKATFSDKVNKSYFVSDGSVYSTYDLGRIGKRLLNKKTISIKVPTTLVRGIAYVNELIVKLGGKSPPLNLEKVKELESLNWKCDIRALKTDFNFQPKYDLERGLEETIKWYKENDWL